MRTNNFSIKALRLALLTMFVAATMIGVNSCRDKFDQEEALKREHEFLLKLQAQKDSISLLKFKADLAAKQSEKDSAFSQKIREKQLEAEIQKRRDSLFMVGGVINYAVKVVDGNSTTFSGTSSNRVSATDMSGFKVTLLHQGLGVRGEEDTDGSGMVVFKDLRVGKVTVTVRKNNFTTASFVADVTPSSPFEKPTQAPVGGNPIGDPKGYTRSTGTVVPVFELPPASAALSGEQLNRFSTISGKVNVDTDLTNFVREVAPTGIRVSYSINADDAVFKSVINRASNNTFGGVNGNNVADGAEGDGRMVQLSYSEAIFTGASDSEGNYTVVVPSFPTGKGLPLKVKYSSFAADQKLYDVVGRVVNNSTKTPVFGVVTKRAVFSPVLPPVAGGGPPNPNAVPSGGFVPNVPAVDVAIASPLDALDASGAKAKAYINDTDGGISRVEISNGGHNYYAAPYVYFAKRTGGDIDGNDLVELGLAFGAIDTDGSPKGRFFSDDQAYGVAEIKDGKVTAVNVLHPGSGYTAETVDVIFLPRGVQPTFAATVYSGGGCLPADTQWEIDGGFTQMPTVVGAPGKSKIELKDGVVTVTLTEEVCGFTPGSFISVKAEGGMTSKMMKLRPIATQEGGSIAALTIAEGQYHEKFAATSPQYQAIASTATTTDDNTYGAGTTEEVLNGLYTQAPLVKITGAGKGAGATTELTDGRVSKINLTGGSGYDKDNTRIRVESSVQDKDGSYTRASFHAKFVPVNGASTLRGAGAVTTVGEGTFYTKKQFDDFNADNTANDLVTLDANYALPGGSQKIDAITQSKTALHAQPAGTPLNVMYSLKAKSGTSDAASVDPDKNDKDPTTAALSTPGIYFKHGGQGYSENSVIKIMAHDPNAIRTPAGAAPTPGDANDVAKFDYRLGTGYVTGVKFNSNATVPPAANPLAIILGEVPSGTYDHDLDATTSTITVIGNNGNTPKATEINPAGNKPLASVNPTPGSGSAVPYQQGQLIADQTASTGSGIAALRPVTGSNGGRFAQTPELQIGGPGSGFEYLVNMNFEHAIQPVLSSFVNNTYKFAVLNPTAASLAPTVIANPGASTVAQRTAVVTFTDIQNVAGNVPTIPARFTARVVFEENLSNTNGAANDGRAFTIINGTFAGSNSGGAGYNAVNINTMELAVTNVANTAGTADVTVPAANAHPHFTVDNRDGTLVSDSNIGSATFNTTKVEGIASMTLGGRIMSIVPKHGRMGTGYAAHPTNTYTIVPTGYSENVPTSAQLGVVTTTPGSTGIQFGGGATTGIAANIISSGNGFPYFPGIENKQFIRLYRRDINEYIPRNHIDTIFVARRIAYIRFRDVRADGITHVYNLAGTATPVGNVNTLTPGTIRYTGANGTGGATTQTAGKTVAAIDEDNDGTSDYFGFVGNGYATPEITLSIMDRSFSNGAPDDAAHAEVRSSGLGIGKVTIRGGNDADGKAHVVHPTVSVRSTTDPIKSVGAEPTFRLKFGKPAGTTNFGNKVKATDKTATYPYRSLLAMAAAQRVTYELHSVDVVDGGKNYTAPPFFRVRKKKNTLVGGTASGETTVGGGKVTGVNITEKGSYALVPTASIAAPHTLDRVLPNITLNDYLYRLYVREESASTAPYNPLLKLNGEGTLRSIIIDDLGEGYTAIPRLMVVSKGNDFDDKNNDGIFQDGEHKGKQAKISIKPGANVSALTAADFVIDDAGDGYTQDPDVVVVTHDNEYLAIPRVNDNPVFVRVTDVAPSPAYTSGMKVGNMKAFVVENKKTTGFAELEFNLIANGTGEITATTAWNGQNNEGTEIITVANLNNNLKYEFDGGVNRASDRKNEGVITRISLGNKGDNLVSGTYPLLITGGGNNITEHAQATVTIADGQAQSVKLTNGGKGYDDNFINPGPNGKFETQWYGADGRPGTADDTNNPALGQIVDDFVGVKVEFPLGQGAAAEGIPAPITGGRIEVIDGGAGYNDELFSVRVVPHADDRAAGKTVEDFLSDPRTAAPNIVETRVSAVKVNETTGAIESITVDPEHPGANYTKKPTVVIETYGAILKREAEKAFFDNENNAGATFNFGEFIQAKVAVEANTNGAITKAKLANPGFGYLSVPEVRVLGIGQGAQVTATLSTDTQTGVGDYKNRYGNYFNGSEMVKSFNFANTRVGGVNVTSGGKGYLGGNFPRTWKAFTASNGVEDGNTFYVPGAINTVNDLYYGTGIRNASEGDDVGKGAGSASGAND